MGNRAVITASKSSDVAKSNDIGIYLHWYGGRDSVEAFLKYCELKKIQKPVRRQLWLGTSVPGDC